MKNNVNNSGFTIIEMLVALALTSILLLSGATMLALGSTSYKQTSSETNLQNESQTTLNFINNLLMKAEYVEYNSGGTKKRYMVDLEAKLAENSGDRKNYSKEIKRILGDTIAEYDYLAVGTNITLGDEISLIMNFVVYKGDKLYFYKTTGDELVVEDIGVGQITTAADDALKEKKKEAIEKALNGGNAYLLTNYVNPSAGFSCTFTGAERNNTSGDKVVDNLMFTTSLKLLNSDNKFDSVASVTPRNKIVYVY